MQLEVEIASIAKMMTKETGITTVHFSKIEDGFETPCIFFPEPHIFGKAHSLSAFGVDFTEYMNIFADTSEEATSAAVKAVMFILSNGWKVPIVDTEGNQTLKSFYMDQPEIKEIEAGVIELKMSWKRRTAFNRMVSEKVESVIFDMKQK